MRSTGHAWPYKHDALLWLVVFQQPWSVHCDPCNFTQWFAPSAVRCRTALLFLRFFIMDIHASGISIPVDIVRVKSYMNCLFDSARVVIRVTINKLHFVPEWLVSGVVSMLWNSGGLGTGKSDVSFVHLNSVLHRSSSHSDVHVTAFTGNPVNYAILFSWVDSVFWSY